MSISEFNIRPYFYLIRLNKPLPILLLLWPTLWALIIANSGNPSIKLTVIFVLGVFLMRSAGCIANDISDRNFDGAVERTKNRPLATKELSVLSAVIFALILFIISFFLVLQLNTYAIYLSLLALGLSIIYPLCKRFFFMPQVVLGMAFNFGIIMVFAASKNDVPLNAYWLYLAAIIWTISYDTIYALADLKYDLQLDLNSSARFFGKYAEKIILSLQSLFILSIAFYGYFSNYSFVYYVILIFTVPFFLYEYSLYKDHEIPGCVKAFSNNQWVGLIVLLAIYTQYALVIF
jgi:4-hydroxybenzoate polyprenyltransferase